MAYIRVPTGIRNVTATAAGKGIICYKCPKCGQTGLFEYAIEKRVSGFYHVFQRKSSKSRIESKTCINARQLVDQEDAALFRGINVEHNYDMISAVIKCRHCGEIQPWSGIPGKWRNIAWFNLWVMGLMFGVSMTLIMVFENPLLSISFLWMAVILAVLPFFRNRKRKKAIEKSQLANFEAPVYYNQSNIKELVDKIVPGEK